MESVGNLSGNEKNKLNCLFHLHVLESVQICVLQTIAILYKSTGAFNREYPPVAGGKSRI